MTKENEKQKSKSTDTGPKHSSMTKLQIDKPLRDKAIRDSTGAIPPPKK